MKLSFGLRDAGTLTSVNTKPPMLLMSTSYASGSPQFSDPRLDSLVREQGALVAWRDALSRGAVTAAGGASGDFAVGLRDDAGRVFLAVDRFAVRSLCYRLGDGELHFAARADELVNGEADVDLQAVFDYLYFHAIPSPRTIFKDVFRLPPGHYALYDKDQLTVAPYWVPTFSEPGGAVSFDTLRAEFRDLIRNAVAKQLDTHKAACFLSGGTDSSTVAGMIREASGRPAATYSIGFEAEGYDEMEFARIAARQFNTVHHEYYVTPDDLVQSIAAVAAYYDQPFGNSSALPAYYCAQMAKADGVKKILAGDGGDELFGGNSRYAKQRIFGFYGSVPTVLRKRLLEPFFELPAVGRIPLLRKGSSYVEQAKVPMPDRLQMYNLLRRLGAETVLTQGFLAQVDQEAPIHQQREVWAQAHAASQVNRSLAFDWRYTLAESDLPKVCGTTTFAGIEVGFPFLDDALLEFSLRLPTHYKLKGLKLRWFFKEALRGFLPDQIITKKKQGFGLPFGVWLTRNPPLKRLAADALGSLSTRGIVRPQFITTLIEQHLPSHPGYYGEMVWILMMLELWLQAHAPNLRVGR